MICLYSVWQTKLLRRKGALEFDRGGQGKDVQDNAAGDGDGGQAGAEEAGIHE